MHTAKTEPNHCISKEKPAARGLMREVKSQTILIVDDNQENRAFLECELKGEGYAILTFGQASDVLALIERRCDEGRVGLNGDIGCVILDLATPDMDAATFCRRLDDLLGKGAGLLPVLMLTSCNSEAETTRALEAGADDFFNKSDDAVVLKARVSALLRRKALHSEHERVLAEFRKKEYELLVARAAEQTALARAALAGELERKNAQLRRTQSQLVQSAKMAALGELVAGLAHEINNPLAYSLAHMQTVHRVLEQIAEDCETELSEDKLDKAKRRISEAIDGLERVAGLVVKLRTFSRLDEGVFKWADIKACVEATLPLVRHRLGERIKIVSDYAEDNNLYCAPGLVNQVILNLLTNAIDAVGGEGEIRIRTSRTKNWFRLSVADTGAGVAPEAKERLFEPFFTTKEVGKGTGLGLAVSYQIVQSHHGDIEAMDREAGGAEFLVTIPTDLAERTDG